MKPNDQRRGNKRCDANGSNWWDVNVCTPDEQCVLGFISFSANLRNQYAHLVG